MNTLRTIIISALFLFILSCRPSSLQSRVTGEVSGLTPAQQQAVIQHTAALPDSSELAFALVYPDSLTFVGFQKISGEMQAIDNAHQLFEIGSITKVFTAGMLAQLVANDSLHLDNPVAQFLPVPLQQPEKEGVTLTLQHLANHSSGLPRIPSNFSPTNPNNPYADYDRADLYEYLSQQQQLLTPPGAQYAYSNLGFGLLGHILTQRTGLDYASLLQRYVTEPLAMDRTFVEVPPALSSARVVGRDAAGGVTANWDLKVLAGAGAIKSTAYDLATWVRANINEQAPTYASWKQCQQPTLEVSEELSTGLGWHITTSPEGDTHWHNGGTGGYRSCVAFRAKRGIGVIVLSNVSAFSPHQNQIDALCFRLLEISLENL